MRSFTPIILILVSVALFFVFVNPHYQQTQLLLEQKTEYEDALNRARELESARDELFTKYNSFSRTDLDRLYRLVPEEINIVKLVADMDDVAGRYGIAIKGISVEEEIVDNSMQIVPEERVNSYLTTSISFSFEVKYDQLVNFIRDLEKSLQVIDIVSVSFSSDEKETEIYEYKIKFNTYRLRP